MPIKFFFSKFTIIGFAIYQGFRIKSQKSQLEFTDFNNIEIVLNDYYYNHIIKKHGSIMTTYHENWVDTLKNPDYIGNGKTHEACNIYAQKNNNKRNYLAKYLIVVVNEGRLITSIRFGSNLNFVNNLKEMP